ncbi:MAG: trypsin-like peptidase domain-containing protein [Melioribacteraceae bacterium]|nr:trypsin-like peptidase domain-containing protein [Melioribacteraceae bacterium]
MKWEGDCINGKANGFGKLTKYKNGEYESTYEGEYQNGIRQGKGTFSHKDGSVFKGTFLNGQLIGFGSVTTDEGSKYEGEFINYRRHGKGILTLPNGSVLDGFFVSDRLHTGKYKNFDGTETYLQEYVPVPKISEKQSGYKPEIGTRLTEYFNADWKRCTQKEAAYYRLVTYEAPNKPKGIIKDYYITGELQSEFFAVYLDYDDEGKNFHEYEATWYFKNGKIQQKRYYMNNRINGKNTFYYDNGQIAQEANYNYGILNGEYKQWHKTGKPRLLALYENGNLVDNKYVEYDENGLGALVYTENFTLNKDIWVSKVASSESSINPSNQLLLSLPKTESIARWNYITLDQKSSYSIECIIHKTKGKGQEGYGLLFGFKDWNNYFSFVISEYGSYKITGYFEGVQLKIADWTKSNVINTGNKRNMLKVFKFEDEFIFSINGQVVHRDKPKDLRGNYHGILATGIGEYILENLIIKEFLSKEELEAKAPKESKGDNWKGNGSGFFINENGYIATNYHVIQDANDIQIEYFQKGTKHIYKAKVIVSDKQNDLAIIKIDDPNFKKLNKIPYVFSTNIKDVGTSVFALGYPIANVMGEEVKFTDGKISSKTGIQGDVTVYQISAPIQPGNSGGPLFDEKGNLVGITSSGLNREFFKSENVNYAIKSTYLKNLIDVMPESINLPNDSEITLKPLTEKVKLLSDYVPLIRIR